MVVVTALYYMNKIKHLSPDIITKIAAGEVIERPSYAVKELIENALDAKATSLQIIIEDEGLYKITVIDDGHGMTKEDLVESVKLHTTSKIFSIDELSRIASFGFRGEALASIAAISKLVIKSRTPESVSGTELHISHGAVKDVTQIGMPIGTNITISQLFQSVPARKKFLKSPQTEYRHILHTILSLTLANPIIGFTFIHNKKNHF